MKEKRTQAAQPFTGFTMGTFDFLAQLALHNEKSYFEARRDDYRRLVQEPMIALESSISPTVLQIDPNVRTGKRAISRIYRDTRFSKDKSPLRDHAWIAYRPPEIRLSEAFCFYMEITPVSYSYGMGMYDSGPAFMADFRQRSMANPARLENILSDEALLSHFVVEGTDYVRPKIPNLPFPLSAVLNKRYFFLVHHSNDLESACKPTLVDELRKGFQTLAPLYRFVQDLEG